MSTDNRGSMFCDYTPQCLCMYCGAGMICFDCHEFYEDCYCESEWDPQDIEHDCGEDACVCPERSGDGE